MPGDFEMCLNISYTCFASEKAENTQYKYPSMKTVNWEDHKGDVFKSLTSYLWLFRSDHVV